MVLDSDDKLVAISKNTVVLIDISLINLDSLYFDKQVLLITSLFFPRMNNPMPSFTLDYDQNIGALLITDTKYELTLYNIRSQI